MSLALYKEIKAALNDKLVPDVINLIINETELLYIKEGAEKWLMIKDKMNLEYKETWEYYELSNSPVPDFLFTNKILNSVYPLNYRELSFFNFYWRTEQKYIWNFNKQQKIGTISSNYIHLCL